MTLVTYRCVPEGGRSRPRPPTPAGGFLLDTVAARVASGPLAAVDVYGRPAGRPRWLAGEYLALLQRQGRGVGVIYLIHFDQPIGDLGNPRGFASHYTWTLDLPARLVDHAAGRGARLMEVVGEQGIGWQLARIWAGDRAKERSLKQSGGAPAAAPSASSPSSALRCRPGRSTRWCWSSAHASPPSPPPPRRSSSRRRWPRDPQPTPPARKEGCLAA